jgi:nucleotide-binding universal stress UspA family protein
MDDAKKIMVALAFTEHSEELFNFALETSKLLNARLIAASVINSRDVAAVGMVASMGYDIDGDHYIEGVKAEQKKFFEQFLKRSSIKNEDVRLILKVGNPVDELLKLIVKEKVDMIVMGIKGRTDLEHVFVGSVAAKLFRHSPVPVISFRDKKSAERFKKRIKTA